MTDSGLIPTGELRSVIGTPFDLRQPTQIVDGLNRLSDDEQLRYGGGYDHNFMLDGEGYRETVTLRSPDSGIVMKVFTDMPGVQLYTGNMLSSNWPGKGGKNYGLRDGLCLETQFPPDAVNHPDFPSAVLKAGERFESTTSYIFAAE